MGKTLVIDTKHIERVEVINEVLNTSLDAHKDTLEFLKSIGDANSTLVENIHTLENILEGLKTKEMTLEEINEKGLLKEGLKIEYNNIKEAVKIQCAKFYEEYEENYKNKLDIVVELLNELGENVEAFKESDLLFSRREDKETLLYTYNRLRQEVEDICIGDYEGYEIFWKDELENVVSKLNALGEDVKAFDKEDKIFKVENDLFLDSNPYESEEGEDEEVDEEREMFILDLLNQDYKPGTQPWEI